MDEGKFQKFYQNLFGNEGKIKQFRKIRSH